MKPSRAATITVVAVTILVTGLLFAQGRRGRFPRGGFGPGGSTLGDQPQAKTDAEKLILDTSRQVPRRSNVPLEDGRLIRLLTEAIGARHAVEIGTSTGYSGLWFAMALRSTGGQLTTFEIDPSTAATAREMFAQAGVSDIITVVEGNAHDTVSRLEGATQKMEGISLLPFARKKLPEKSRTLCWKLSSVNSCNSTAVSSVS